MGSSRNGGDCVARAGPELHDFVDSAFIVKGAKRMPKLFQIENYTTREWVQVEAENLEEACKKLGWKIEDAYVRSANVVIPREQRLGW